MEKTQAPFPVLVTVETRLTKEDYRRFLYFTLYFRKAMYLPVAFVCCLLVGAVWGNHVSGFQWPLFLSGFLGTLGLLTIMLISRVELRLRKRVKEDTDGTFEKYDIIQFGEVLIQIDSDVMNASGTCAYDTFHQVLETRSAFLLYPNPQICSIIPKHNMTKEQQETLARLLQKNTGMRYHYRRWSV